MRGLFLCLLLLLVSQPLQAQTKATCGQMPNLVCDTGDTMTGPLSFTGSNYIAFNTDPAETGSMRLGNTDPICWEKSPAGNPDICMYVDATESFIFGDTSAAGDLLWLSGTTFYGTLAHANTAQRTWDFPDASGTVLLTTTIPSYIRYASITTLLNIGGL